MLTIENGKPPPYDMRVADGDCLSERSAIIFKLLLRYYITKIQCTCQRGVSSRIAAPEAAENVGPTSFKTVWRNAGVTVRANGFPRVTSSPNLEAANSTIPFRFAPPPVRFTFWILRGDVR